MAHIVPPQSALAQAPAKPRRALGLWSSMALVIGGMIGSGIFLLPASLAPFGGISLLGWLLTTAGALLLALLFSRLASMAPKVGGPYAYTRMGFGDFAGFWIAWGYWISVWTGNAALAVALVSYLQGVLPALAGHLWVSALIAIGVIWLVTWINLLGIKQAGIFQVLTTMLKLLPLLALAGLGLFWVQWSHFTPFNTSGMSPFAAVTAAATLTLWAFLGLESATIPADDVEHPDTTIPRATVLGTIVTALVYILSFVAVMGLVPLAQLSKSSAPYADAAGMIWGRWAFYAVGIGAVISCLGNLNGFTLIQGQVPMAAAQDRLFPKAFGQRSKQGVPWFGVVISSALITLLLVFNYSGSGSLVQIFTFIILLTTLTTLVPYAFCAMAELLLLIQHRAQFNAKRLVGSSVIGILAFAYAVWTVYGSGAQTVLLGFLLLLLGLPVYVWMRKQQADEADAQHKADKSDARS
jgi:APA family basic amino acid/polyamine antiporter